MWKTRAVRQGQSKTFLHNAASYAVIRAVLTTLLSVGFILISLAAPMGAQPGTCDNVVGGAGWINHPFTAQSGLFTAVFDATPGAAGAQMDTVIALSNSPQSNPTDFTGFAVLVRFNALQTIDARNGGSYPPSSVSYSAGTLYHFRVAVNIPQHTYSVYVTPAGGVETQVALNYAFRTEQASVSTLSNVGLISDLTGSTVVCNFGLPPTADSVTPSSGTGLSQMFTFKYSSPNGFGFLTDVYALFQTSINGANACLVLYDKGTGSFYLYNDAGNGTFGPLPVGSTSSLTNSQCTLNGTGSSISGAGNMLTMILNLTFKTPVFETIFMYAADAAGQTSDWQARGTWTVPPPSGGRPTADSVSPASGIGLSQIFTFKYSSGNGFAYLKDVYALFNGAVNGASACFVVYDAMTNGFYLYNDAGNGASGPLSPGANASLMNSQCTLNGVGSSVSGSGNTLMMVLNLTFKIPAFAGKKNIYTYAADAAGQNSGWQNCGMWTVSGGPPTAGPVTPNPGMGSVQSFTFQYSSPNGFGFLSDVYALFQTSINGANACFVVYDAPTNGFYLYNDAGNGTFGPLPVGSTSSLTNSQCTLNGVGSSVSGAGYTLTMILNLTFKTPAFAGTKTIFVYAVDAASQNSGWQGPWTVPGPVAYDLIIVADRPVAFWDINPRSATEIDRSGNGNVGTYKNYLGPSQTVLPSVTMMPNGDPAGDFNGSNQYLSVLSNASLSIPTTQNLTWEAWIRPDVLEFPNQNADNYVSFMGKCEFPGSSPTCEWEGRMYSATTPQGRCNRLSGYAFNPAGHEGSGADWQPACPLFYPGEWLHIVAEYTTLSQPADCPAPTPYPGSIDIWVNGVKWNQAAHNTTGCMSQYMVTPMANNSPLNIGTMAYDVWFKGAIGKVAIYNYLLSPTQITNHYQAMTRMPVTGSCGNTCTF